MPDNSTELPDPGKNVIDSDSTKEMDYSLVWCSSSYQKQKDGFLVHAAADDQLRGWTNPRTLCGVKWNDAGWGLVGKHGYPGCSRCIKALEKLGIRNEQNSL